ncbi:MAG: hypothetical protein WCF57_04015 [Pyrinomonadaceae bacterium]
MSEGRKLFLLANAELRDRWRWARQHLYALLILSPLVLGMTYLTLARMASYDLALERPPTAVQIMLAALSVLALIALNLSRASREVYHLRQPAFFSESLPVRRATHLRLAILARLGRTLVLGLVLIILRSLLLGDAVRVTDIASLAALLIFVVLIPLAEVYAALNWIHWGSLRDKQAVALALLVLVMSAGVSGLLLVLFFNPAGVAEFTARLAPSLAARAPSVVAYIIYAGGCLWAASIYWLAHRAHERWRATDIDYAQRLSQGGRLNLGLIGFLHRRMARSVAAMLDRDLRLTLRTFSSAVYVAAGVCLMLVLSLLVALTTNVLPSGPEFLGGLAAFGWSSATWLPAVIAIKLACALAAAALGCVVPVLVYYQLPHLWLERATGATGEDVWKAKLWYARVVTLPVVLLIYTLGVAVGAVVKQGGGVPLVYVVPLLAECLWLWWLVSTIAGALSFEMPDRPELAIVMILTMSISMGALTAVLWPMGVGFYAMAIAGVAERGGARARYYLVTEGE